MAGSCVSIWLRGEVEICRCCKSGTDARSELQFLSACTGEPADCLETILEDLVVVNLVGIFIYIVLNFMFVSGNKE